VFSLYSAGLAVFATKKIKKVGAKWKIAGFVSKSAQKRPGNTTMVVLQENLLDITAL